MLGLLLPHRGATYHYHFCRKKQSFMHIGIKYTELDFSLFRFFSKLFDITIAYDLNTILQNLGNVYAFQSDKSINFPDYLKTLIIF